MAIPLLSTAEASHALASTGAPPLHKTAIVSMANRSALLALADLANVTVLHTYRTFPGALVAAPDPILASLRLLPGVLGVYPNLPIVLHTDLARPVEDVPDPLPADARGSGVVVAVVDAGIDSTHPGLSGRVSNYLVTPAGVQSDPTGTGNGSAHGTAVAGIVIGSGADSPYARYRGMAPGASIVGLDFSQDMTQDGALRAFDWIDQNAKGDNVRVVSNSWGLGGETPGVFDPSAPIVRASDTLVTKDHLVVVFSAGNQGGRGSILPEALNPNVLTVGATDAGGKLASYSSQGPGRDASGAPLPWTKPDLVAVGDRVVSARGGTATPKPNDRTVAPEFYVEDSGTSFAAPMVSGAAALLLSEKPTLDPFQVRGILVASARPLDQAVPNNETGGGLLDVSLALALAQTGTVGPLNETTPLTTPPYGGNISGANGIVLSTDAPTTSGTQSVGYVPVLPGSGPLQVWVNWSGTGPLPASFTAALVRPDGSPGPALNPRGATALVGELANPAAGVWEIAVTPTSPVLGVSLSIVGRAAVTRAVPTLDLAPPAAALAPASALGTPTAGLDISTVLLVALVVAGAIAGTLAVLSGRLPLRRRR
jgi:hypothetical protein